MHSYLTATAMLPIGLIGNGLAPGNIPLLSTRAPFCITPEGTKNKTKHTMFFLLKEKLEKYRSKMWNSGCSMYWKTIREARAVPCLPWTSQPGVFWAILFPMLFSWQTMVTWLAKATAWPSCCRSFLVPTNHCSFAIAVLLRMNVLRVKTSYEHRCNYFVYKKKTMTPYR